MRYILPLAICLLLQAITVAEPITPEVRERLDKLSARGAEVEDVTAEFTQKKYSPLLKKPMVSTGMMRGIGSRLRWDTTKPHRSMAMLDDKFLQLYFPDQKLLEKYSLDRNWLPLTTSPVPDYKALQSRFEIDLVTADPLKLQLSPRDEKLKPHLTHILVQINEKLAVMDSMEFVTPEGDRTVIELSKVKTNTGLKDSQLDLNVPSSVRVVEPLAGHSSSN